MKKIWNPFWFPIVSLLIYIITFRKCITFKQITKTPITTYLQYIGDVYLLTFLKCSRILYSLSFQLIFLCSLFQSGPGLGIMIIEGKHAEVGQGIFISDIQEGSAAEQVCVMLKQGQQVELLCQSNTKQVPTFSKICKINLFLLS